MSRIKTELRFPNSMLIVTGSESFEVPEDFCGRLVAATSSCVAVGTAPESDAATTVVVVTPDFTANHTTPLKRVFSGRLDTDARTVAVRTVGLKTVLSAPVDRDESCIEIWVDHPVAPSTVVIVVGGATG